MDEQRSKAVTEAFVRLHKDGLIYRLVASPSVVASVSVFYYHLYVIQ
jgi:hypothetical protein